MLNEHLEAMFQVLQSIQKLPRMQLVITPEFKAILDKHFAEHPPISTIGDMSAASIYGIPVIVESDICMWSESYYGRIEVLLPNGEVDWNKVTWISK